jgi:hypothetical protein
MLLAASDRIDGALYSPEPTEVSCSLETRVWNPKVEVITRGPVLTMTFVACMVSFSWSEAIGSVVSVQENRLDEEKVLARLITGNRKR